VRVKEKRGKLEMLFDVHANNGEQAIELSWHIMEDEFGGEVNDYEFTLVETLHEPRVVSYG
jgi:hypothetical protein